MLLWSAQLAFDVVAQPFGQGDYMYTELSIHSSKGSLAYPISQLLFKISGLSGLNPAMKALTTASQPRVW